MLGLHCRRILLFILLCLSLPGQVQGQNDRQKQLVGLSRRSCVLIFNDTTKGTGFFVDEDVILTNFHVATYTSSETNRTRNFKTLKIVTFNRDTIQVEGILGARVLDNVYFMRDHDFAFLKLKKKAAGIQLLKFANDDELKQVDVLDSVLFTGYPLPYDVPVMLTHTGTVSGIFKDSLIYIQTPINKGNSGGAVLNSKGNVVGLVTFKIGGIGKQLEQVVLDLESMLRESPELGMNLGKINSTQLSMVTLKLMNQYFETGIGGAVNIRFARSYYLAQTRFQLFRPKK